MNLFLWSRPIPRRLSGSRQPNRSGVPLRRPFRPLLEPLESRLVPATFNPVDTAGLIGALSAADAAPSDTTLINLQAGTTYNLTTVNNYWYGPNGLPPIASNVVIHGNGATIQRDTSSATTNFRLFYVSGGMELTPGHLMMDNVTLQGGMAKGGASSGGGGGLGAGGAIFNQGMLNLTDVTLTNNQAVGGSSGLAGIGAGGGGMGQDAQGFSGGGFGSDLGGTFGGSGGPGFVGVAVGSGGGGGGFVTGADGGNGTADSGGPGGGNGGFAPGGSGDGGSGGSGSVGGGSSVGNGGSFGVGGFALGGGGGVGGGGGADNIGGAGGFGGGGAVGINGAAGGFGGGGGGGFGPSGTGGGVGGSAAFGGGLGSGATGGGGAGMGGAIFNMGADSAHPTSGQAILINCTLTKNIALGGNVVGGSTAGSGGSGLGGALFNLDGQVTLDSDTLAGNQVAGGPSGNGITGAADGGAVYNLAFGNDIDTGSQVAATLVLHNSIFATSTGGSDLTSMAFSGNGTNTATVMGSHNLVMTSAGTINPGVITLTADPNLGALQNNGGLTPTMRPAAGSPVFGAGDPANSQDFDQRGQPRPLGGPTDLGAVQVSIAPNPGGGGGGGGGSTGGGGSSASPPTPVGQLMPFAFGIVNNQLEIIFIDQKGQVFDETFTFNNFFTPNPGNAQFLNTQMFLTSPTSSDALGYPAILSNLAESNSQEAMMITIPLNFMSQAALNDVIFALELYKTYVTVNFSL